MMDERFAMNRNQNIYAVGNGGSGENSGYQYSIDKLDAVQQNIIMHNAVKGFSSRQGTDLKPEDIAGRYKMLEFGINTSI